MNKTIENLYEIDKTSNFSIYHGKFSYFKYIYILNSITEENHINENIVRNLLKLINEYNIHIGKSWYPIDYMGGLTGIISLLIDFIFLLTIKKYYMQLKILKTY